MADPRDLWSDARKAFEDKLTADEKKQFKKLFDTTEESIASVMELLNPDCPSLKAYNEACKKAEKSGDGALIKKAADLFNKQRAELFKKERAKWESHRHKFLLALEKTVKEMLEKGSKNIGLVGKLNKMKSAIDKIDHELHRLHVGGEISGELKLEFAQESPPAPRVGQADKAPE